MAQAALSRDISFLDLPLDGVAAYWLSLRKVAGNSRNLKALEQEAQYVSEPFVRHLLDMAVNAIPAGRFAQFATVAAVSELSRLERQLDLMRLTILDIAQGENPTRTLARMSACFAGDSKIGDSLLDQAQSLAASAISAGADSVRTVVRHDLADVDLCTALLFQAVIARRHGKAACRPFLSQRSARYYSEGIALVLDGFDVPFVQKWLKKFKGTLFVDMQKKMDVSIKLCSAIIEKQPFEELRYLVRCYLR